jgi:hypothetical protein
MNSQSHYFVMLFKAVSYVLKAEKILKTEKLPHKLIPVPKQISSDCGICLRYEACHRDAIESCLRTRVDYDEGRRMAN